MKAKLKYTNLNFDYYNKYDIKIDKFTSVEFCISANIYKVTNDLDVYDVEIQDTEATFYINGKATQYQGYKNLYNSLYGENAYIKLYDELEKIAEDKFVSDINVTPLINKLSPIVAKKYLWNLLRDTEKYPTLQTTIKNEDNDIIISYSDSYVIQKFAQVIDKKLTFKHMCKYTTNERVTDHMITNVTDFLK